MFKKLRKNYPEFVFENYSWKKENNDFLISFDFKIKPDISFNPQIKIKDIKDFEFNEELINNLVFNLGLVEMISYWKVTCSPVINIKAGNLNEEQIDWWKDLILNGMGQYFFENKIDWRKDSFLEIKVNKKKTIFEKSDLKLEEGILLPIGGGKDSIVSLELLKDKKVSCFSLNPIRATKEIIKTGDCKEFIQVKREIDPSLLELNKKGFLNGHTPFSAYLAFLTVLTGYLFNKKYVVLSNERSSNEGNLEYLGKEINHQYSKTFDFEKKFRSYSKKYLIKEIKYFSFLRPLYELQITKIFSKFKKYFPIFLSCNEAQKTCSGTKEKIGKWCGQCSKCLFIYICLYPFINKEEIINIFGEDLFKKESSLPIIKQLLGVEDYSKPFECVGTHQESLIALYLSWKKEKENNLPLVLDYFEKNILKEKEKLEKESQELLSSWNEENNLPKSFIKILKK
jgi:hypothetical protein